MEAFSLPQLCVTTIIISQVYLIYFRDSDISFLSWVKDWHQTKEAGQRHPLESWKFSRWGYRKSQGTPSAIDFLPPSLLCFPFPFLSRVVLDFMFRGEGGSLQSQRAFILANSGSSSKGWETNSMNEVAQEETRWALRQPNGVSYAVSPPPCMCWGRISL